MKRSSALWLTLIFVVALGRIASTWRIFSVTYDEPVHVAAGYDYLRYHTFLDMQHPPLAKAIFALPFRNAPEPGTHLWIRRGNTLLYDQNHYLRGPEKARAGNLVFVVIALFATFFWTRDLFDEATAVVATAVLSLLPPVLAHGGLATTDMAAAASFAVAMFAYDRFLANPSWLGTSGLAAAIAFGTLSKFSFPLFFVIGAICLSIARRRIHAKRFFAASGAAFVIVWAAYFFTFGTIQSAQPMAAAWSQEMWGHAGLVRKLPLPAPAFFAGLLEVVRHDHIGHQSFLLGEYRDHGWWYYFPVALLVKTPIPMILLAVVGAWLAAKRKRHGEAAAIALALLAAVMTSRIDIGVRHILPMYVPLSMLAGFAAVAGWRMSMRHRGAVALAFVWLLADGVIAHPDYLPWMNALAGPHPERVLADSNFDWGQDLVRLRTVCRERKIDRLGVLFVASGASDQLWMPPFDPNPIGPYAPVKGWIAVGETPLQMNQALDPNSFTWLTANRPFIRVGKTIRLYHVD